MSTHPGTTLPVLGAGSQVSLANLGLSFARDTGGLVLSGEKNKRIPCSGKTKYNFHGLLVDGHRDCGDSAGCLSVGAQAEALRSHGDVAPAVFPALQKLSGVVRCGGLLT